MWECCAMSMSVIKLLADRTIVGFKMSSCNPNCWLGWMGRRKYQCHKKNCVQLVFTRLNFPINYNQMPVEFTLFPIHCSKLVNAEFHLLHIRWLTKCFLLKFFLGIYIFRYFKSHYFDSVFRHLSAY